MKWGNNMQRVKLKDILSYEQPTKYIVDSTNYKDEYETPVLTPGLTFILGYTNETDGVFKASEEPIILFDDFTTSSKFVDFDFKVKSSAVKILHCNEKVANIKYVYYAMQNLEIDTSIHKRYWISVFSELEIPLPSLETQELIVEKMDQVNQVIDYKRQQLDDLKKYLSSKFNEIFIQNKDSSNYKKLGELCEFYNGKAHENYVVDDQKGKFILVNAKFISTEGTVYKTVDEQLTPLFKNDITMVMSDVPNGRALAKCFLVDADDKYSLNQRICALRTNKINPTYLYKYLNRNEYFLNYDNGQGQTNLRKDDILACPILIPSKNEQEEYEKIEKEINSISREIEKSLKDLESLFNSLIEKYYN